MLQVSAVKPDASVSVLIISLLRQQHKFLWQLLDSSLAMMSCMCSAANPSHAELRMGLAGVLTIAYVGQETRFMQTIEWGWRALYIASVPSEIVMAPLWAWHTVLAATCQVGMTSHAQKLLHNKHELLPETWCRLSIQLGASCKSCLQLIAWATGVTHAPLSSVERHQFLHGFWSLPLHAPGQVLNPWSPCT